MLMRNPQHRVRQQQDGSAEHSEPAAIDTSHQMLFGQLTLIAVFSAALLLRALA
ncbi:hypothetical protein [Stieleria neptunia]|nr:hypothetical protein [Stieleria neptunia]